jgi:hypothetical protein
MSIRTLKVGRLLIPGVLIIVLFLFVIQDNFDQLSELTKAFGNLQLEDTLIMGVVIVIGALYYILNIRNLLWNPYLMRVQNNIKTL